MNDNRQPVGVGCLEYPSNSFNVVFVLEVHRGRGEMQFEALERPVLRAPIELLQRILFQRVETAKAEQTIREPGNLSSRPVVLGPNRCVDIVDFDITQGSSARRRVEPVRG